MNVIRIVGTIDEDMVDAVLTSLQEIEKATDLTLEIHSHGGGVHSTFAIYDALLHSGHNITGVVYGVAASGGLTILQVADQRLAYPNTSFMLHSVTHELCETHTARELKEYSDEACRLNVMVEAIISRRAKGCKTELREILASDRDVWLSAQQAKDWGLIDEIIVGAPRRRRK